MSKFPHGFFAVFLLLCLLAFVALPSHGTEVIISETEWNGLKLHYAQLKTAHQSLSASLENSQSKVTELNRNLAEQWLLLNTAKNSAASLASQLETAQTQAELLDKQLTESAQSLNQLKADAKRSKIKAYLIGGAVGLGIGILTGVLLGTIGG